MVKNLNIKKVDIYKSTLLTCKIWMSLFQHKVKHLTQKTKKKDEEKVIY